MDPRYTNFGVKSPVNSRSSANGAWWLPILEKAYAKFSTTYSNMNGGSVLQGMRDLSNMPVESFKPANLSDDDLFAKI